MKYSHLAFRCFPAALALGIFSAVASSGAGAQELSITPVDSLKVKEGFHVEALYAVPKEEQGSWVAMTVDPKGRLIVCDQYGGLYRVTPEPVGSGSGVELVESIPVEFGEAQGLLYAFDSLYAVVNGNAAEGRGLYRITDTDGDDMLDQVKLLKKFEEQGGEHGPHAVVLGPDGQSLYIVVGNQTSLPEYDRSRLPEVWSEDLLLPRIYGRGFMRGVLAPRGWIAKTDPDGEHWEIVATGFRNEYDAAFNRDGELFTYDADMEWDMNTPWYRPTRVCHVVSGAEFGWRNGSGKWPVRWPDSLPPVVDIGPGSPTGVTFGYGADFPAPYQEAFFICDWSYGKLYAVHLTPDGSTYTGEFEEFISGQPLPLTDILINPVDRAMYFAIGGRRAQSGLYRVTYVGDESRESAPEDGRGAVARGVRRALESFHGVQDTSALEQLAPFLDSEDRFIRYAARTALESQPVETWASLALDAGDPEVSLATMLALARVGGEDYRYPILEKLGSIGWDALDSRQRIEFVRIVSLVFSRMGAPDEERAVVIADWFSERFPTGTPELDMDLLELLVFLQAPSAATEGVRLLTASPTQEEQIGFAKTLRLLKTGWTEETRRAYFSWFQAAKEYRGGASFRNFIESIQKDALESTPADQRETYAAMLESEIDAAVNPFATAKAREFVQAWTLDDLTSGLESGLSGDRDFASGRQLFAEAMCFSCHRFGGEGGAFGPDLTGVAGRFGPKDLLESIIDPSKEISDQYGSIIVTLKDGPQVYGRVVNLGGDGITLNTNMFDPNANRGINRNEIDTIEESPVSMMPPGLLNTLSEDEVHDLLAYILSGGDPENAIFR